MSTLGSISSLLEHTTVPTGPATSAASASGAGASGLTTLGGDFNSFLKLVTAQLKNQDPANPVTSQDFTQQLIQYSGVQQQSQTNSTLQQLLTAVQGMQIGSASSYVGADVTAKSSQASLSGGTMEFGYMLPQPAASVQVSITNANGDLVFSGAGTGQNGSNLASWDGTNSFTGAKEPDGAYNVIIKAADANGAPLTATSYIQGTVSSASLSNGSVMMQLGSVQVPLSNISAISHLTHS